MMMSKENEWEKLDKLLVDVIGNCANPKEAVKYINRVKNYVVKERILAQFKENRAWSEYFASEEINEPDMCKHFEAMGMKLQSLLTRFED
jgi:hypothetical protein